MLLPEFAGFGFMLVGLGLYHAAKIYSDAVPEGRGRWILLVASLAANVVAVILSIIGLTGIFAEKWGA